MKNFKGKAIYNPSGKAGEYSYWACNFYVGCSGMCSYCYCKKGILAKSMGGNKPVLKKCFKNEKHALEVFEKELAANLSELQKHGLFFSFTTDPCLPETWGLTGMAINICREHDVPFKILTKRTDWSIDQFVSEFKTNNTIWNREPKQHLWAFGYTLTGHDELEPGCATNSERFEAMKKLHEAGFEIFASIEPIIDFKSSFEMILHTAEFCNVFKIGLESGKKYSLLELKDFIQEVIRLCEFNKVYFKDSILKQAGIERDTLPECCVNADYNMFKS